MSEKLTDEQARELLQFWEADLPQYEAAADAAQAAMRADMNEETISAYNRAYTQLMQGKSIIERLTERFESQRNPSGLTDDELDFAQRSGMTPERYAAQKASREQEDQFIFGEE